MKHRGSRKKSRQFRNRTKRAAVIVQEFYEAYPALRGSGDYGALQFMSRGEKENFWVLKAKAWKVPVMLLKGPNTPPLSYRGAVTGRFYTTKENADSVLRNVERYRDMQDLEARFMAAFGVPKELLEQR